MKDAAGRRLDSFNAPRDLPKCVAWFDATQATGVDGESKMRWRDQSGYSNDAQAPALTNAATLRKTGGRSYYSFGATSWLRSSTFGSASWGQSAPYTQPNTIIIVARVSSTVGTGAERNLIAGNLNSNRHRMFVNSTPRSYGQMAANVSAAGGGPNLADDQWHVLAAVFDSTSCSFYVDGYLVSALASQAQGSDGFQFLNLGAKNDGTLNANGVDIAEVIVCNDRLTPGRILDVTRTLAAKHTVPAVLPAAQDGVTYLDTTSSNGQAIRYWMPSGTGPAPLMIYSHPSGGTALVDPGYWAYHYVRAFVNEGWIVAASNLHGENWGSNQALADTADLYASINALRTVTKTVMWGGSMGGLVSSLAVANATVPNIKGVLLQDGVLNLANMYANAAYTAGIDTAYGITRGTLSGATTVGATSIPTTASFPTVGTQLLVGNGTANAEIVTTTGASTGTSVAVTALTKAHASAEQVSDYPTKSAGHDPMLVSTASYGAVGWNLTASTADTTVPEVSHADPFAAKVTGTAAEVAVFNHGMGHLHGSSQRPADGVAFVKRCLAR
ncbi:LamG-like jellyroll fold domain-containing protein [Pseudarthrobacter sp. BRE9]|uniref:LamG-like jellyroll fold domain-containing protein n=1 Tax=Pseudarthrobacter sp. BRE9 TaxID=2962582 RepID=UPI002881A601|nr:LamG-like jellyroll fold domain-containing protein [Pseudarthrobacter sp. BRE9]MDT0171007.1 LamG-like jellyroll fold domain-containing protein [Pseudarthrobacter sp. BRE9]